MFLPFNQKVPKFTHIFEHPERIEAGGWKLTSAIEGRENSAFQVFEHNGVPVLVCADFARARNDSRELPKFPHVQIRLTRRSRHEDEKITWYWTEVNVFASPQGGFDLIFQAVGDNEISPTRLLALAMQQLDDAAQIVRGHIDAIIQRPQMTDAQQAAAFRYDAPLSRADYEHACDANNVECMTDPACDSYGVKYGEFNSPEYSVDMIAKMHLAKLRLQGIINERAESHAAPANTTPAPVKMQGQISEACECCGQLPVYLPLLLCENCWPKSGDGQLIAADDAPGRE